jgi:hypothetical protein
LVVRFNHAADSIALVIIDIVLCGVAFVCYGSTAIIAGKDKTQVQQKRYRYTGKEVPMLLRVSRLPLASKSLVDISKGTLITMITLESYQQTYAPKPIYQKSKSNFSK